MIRVGEDWYSKMYRIDPIDPGKLLDLQAGALHSRLEDLLCGFPGDVTLQFLVQNRALGKDMRTEKLLYDPAKQEPALREAAEAYNEVVTDHAGAGYHNARRDVFFLLGLRADSADDAVERFRKLEDPIREGFRSVYELSVTWLPLPERLKVLHGIFHPGGGTRFGDRIDLTGQKALAVKDMIHAGLTTKDVIAPEQWNTSEKLRDHSILNGRTDEKRYARAFFLNLIPQDLSPSFLCDLTNTSAAMLLSLIFEPVDVFAGYTEVASRVQKNMVIKDLPKRDTFLDRKNQVVQRIEEAKSSTEKTYQERAALRTLKEAKDRRQRAFLATGTIVLFAEDLDALEKDSALLRLSASKFSVNLGDLDLLQCQGFQTTLPLCKSRIDAARFLSAGRLADLTPTGIEDAIRKDGQHCGLNAVNDALVLLNRKNHSNRNGAIIGTARSGKTYQCKREILNALLGTKDNVTVVTDKEDYDGFAERIGGNVGSFSGAGIFDMEDGYGLTESDYSFKAEFLTAVSVAALGSGGACEKNENKVREELSRLIRVSEAEKLRGEKIGEYLSRMEADYSFITRATREIEKRYKKGAGLPDERFTVIKVRDDLELLLSLDLLWNKAIRDKKNNQSGWIFLDPADGLFQIGAVSSYLLRYQKMASLFQTPFTLVIDRVASLFSEPASGVALERAVQGCGYVKLLNQGPKERRRFASLLSIPQALIPYISNTEPGKGIILTPSSDIPFNDNYMELYPDAALRRILTA